MTHSRLTRLAPAFGRRLTSLLKTSSLATALAVLAASSLLLPASPQAQAQELAQAAQAATAAPVNINTADAETLAGSLQGVGLSRAEEIIRYREAYGPFESVDELADVKGIGPATLDKNRTLITLE